jgi:NADPH:quinone reductase-like Zn-dependent oxidoreductase
MIGIGARAENGTVEVLDLPAPRVPQAGELLLQTISAGIGPWDALLHITDGWDVGLKPPAALGVEGVGRVIAVGPDVEGFHTGDVVVVHDTPLPGGSGTWAEQVLVHSASAALLPPDLTPELAAALPVAALTASQSLEELQTVPGTRLLVVGSGPTAALAVRLGVLAGAQVVAAASTRHATRLRELGAIDIIDSHADNWAQTTDRRFDAVLVAADGTSEEAMKLIDDGGRLTSITSDAPDPTPQQESSPWTSARSPSSRLRQPKRWSLPVVHVASNTSSISARRLSRTLRLHSRPRDARGIDRGKATQGCVDVNPARGSFRL